jgi:hypothetical protein
MSTRTFSTSVLLVFAVLLASLKLTVHMHFCMDRLVNVSFYAEAQPCIVFEDWENASCPFHSDDQEKPGCCDDETEVYETEDFLFGKQSIVSNPPILQLISDLEYSIQAPSFFTEQNFLMTAHKSPPPPGGRQICIAVQSFLI